MAVAAVTWCARAPARMIATVSTSSRSETAIRVGGDGSSRLGRERRLMW
jgi:hypothetical protein